MRPSIGPWFKKPPPDPFPIFKRPFPDCGSMCGYPAEHWSIPRRRPAVFITWWARSRRSTSCWDVRPQPAPSNPPLKETQVEPNSKSTLPQGTAPRGSVPTYRGSFAVMTVLFFMWGFMTVFNDILIPRFKEAFTLDYFQAMLVQFAFFGAYFIGALSYFLISAMTGDPIARIGYKNGLVIGLVISAAGSAIFWPAATVLSYPLFLIALFVVGLGFAVLQISANPYVTILG